MSDDEEEQELLRRRNAPGQEAQYHFNEQWDALDDLQANAFCSEMGDQLLEAIRDEDDELLPSPAATAWCRCAAEEHAAMRQWRLAAVLAIFGMVVLGCMWWWHV